jgi:hypothetical protein
MSALARFCTNGIWSRIAAHHRFVVRAGEFVSAIVVSVALLTCFGLWVTLHCALAYRLVRRTDKRWQLLWLLLPPVAWLAPYWGFRSNLRALSVSWLVCCAAYLTLLFVGSSWAV